MRKLPKFAAGLLLLAGSIGGAHAAAISTDQWYAFQWSGPAPASAYACQSGDCSLLTGAIDAPVDSPWTIIGPLILRITDAFAAIDQFEVFDNLVSVGITSAFAGTGSCGPSVEDCFSDPDFSHGTFALGGGSHSITISTVSGSSTQGAAYFRVESVPEPATLALFGLGLAGLGAIRRKRS